MLNLLFQNTKQTKFYLKLRMKTNENLFKQVTGNIPYLYFGNI